MKTIGNYTIIKELGEGAFSTVFLGVNNKTQKHTVDLIDIEARSFIIDNIGFCEYTDDELLKNDPIYAWIIVNGELPRLWYKGC